LNHGMNAFTRGLVGLQLSAGINAARCLRLMTSLPRCAHASSHVTVFAPAIELKEHFQEVLLPGQRRQVGSCVVYRTGDMLRLERAAEPGNVQSEWDVGQRGRRTMRARWPIWRLWPWRHALVAAAGGFSCWV